MNYSFFHIKRRQETIIRFEDWIMILRLARQFGWEPLGAIYPMISIKTSDNDLTDDLLDPMDYISANGQIVSRDDAINLADALDRGMSDYPYTLLNDDWDEEVFEIDGDPKTTESIKSLKMNIEEIDPRSYFLSPTVKTDLGVIIMFFREGEFIINKFTG